jgi:hypothetical protein
MIEKVSNDLKSKLPPDLVNALLASYNELKQNFYIGKHEPSELNGGKFCEACFRILQHETNGGSYTSIGTSVPDLIGKLRDFEKLPATTTNESFRIHIPRVLVTIYNIRNKRGVGHLGGDVNPNYTDSSLLVACADWIMAELFRIYYQCSLEEAQGIVNAIIQRRLNLIHEIETTKRVLLPSLSSRNQTLLLLASIYPNKALVSNLISWIEPGNKSRYQNNVLRQLHKDRLIEYDKSGWCVILPTGLSYVASQYSIWLMKLEGS